MYKSLKYAFLFLQHILSLIFLCYFAFYVESSSVRGPTSSTPICTNSSCGEYGHCPIEDESSCICDPGYGGYFCTKCAGRQRILVGDGFITDGKRNYEPHQSCSFLLQSSAESVILSLEFISTECNWDHVFVYDGDSVYSPMVASLSGLYGNDSLINGIKEIQSTGNSLYVYFKTDSKNEWPGFHIGYRAGGCLYNCSDSGQCTNNTCTCVLGRTGRYCEHERCPLNCSRNGRCDAHLGCNCDRGFSGDDCSSKQSEISWQRWPQVDTQKLAEPGWRAVPAPVTTGHSTLHLNDALWLVTGLTVPADSHARLLRLDLKTRTWRERLLVNRPNSTYGHSLVAIKDSLYLFGGTSDARPVPLLWRYTPGSSAWDSLAPALFPVTGHTAHVTSSGHMIVFFGLSLEHGYLNLIQQYNPDTDTWSVLKPGGAHVRGTYGHASVYHSYTDSVYVHGGIIATGVSTQQTTNQLLRYDVTDNMWYTLRSRPQPVYLHSAAVLGEVMYSVFGNLSQPDTDRCYTSQVFAYDIPCDTWYEVTGSNKPSSRYGHSSTALDSSLYIYGGFDGQTLGDAHLLTPGWCKDWRSLESCERAAEGSRCYWVSSQCLDRRGVEKLSKGSEDRNVARACSLVARVESAADTAVICESAVSCRSCLYNSNDCVWCASGCTSSGNCANPLASIPVQCPARETGCSLFVNCRACQLDSACVWDTQNSLCVDKPVNETVSRQNTTSTAEDMCEVAACSSFDSCYSCTYTGSDCSWCASLGRCVDSNTLTSSFPYGRCTQWTHRPDYCTELLYDVVSACSDCLASAGWGWCNYPNNTGLGRCVPGTPRAPLPPQSPKKSLPDTCSLGSWFYFTCPLCQCNGHSMCEPGSSECVDCKHHTTGEHCQFCEPGYYGNPINGANCTECFCNGHGSLCNNMTGSCFCETRGAIGNQCELCDLRSGYVGNPRSGTCYYNLSTDFVFTFNLSKDQDKHYKRINLMNTPPLSDHDVEFSIKTSQRVFINVTAVTDNFQTEEQLFHVMTQDYKYKFKHKRLPELGARNTSFRVYVSNFTVPLVIEVFFSQQPQIKLVNFFITFFSCFLSLVIVAAMLWKVKMRYDMFRRQQRMQTRLVAMANRPFARIRVDLTRTGSLLGTGPDHAPLIGSRALDSGHLSHQRKLRQFVGPAAVAVEPLSQGKAQVLTVLVSLPTGEDERPPEGQAGLSLGSVLVSNYQRTQAGHKRNASVDSSRSDRHRRRLTTAVVHRPVSPQFQDTRL